LKEMQRDEEKERGLAKALELTHEARGMRQLESSRIAAIRYEESRIRHNIHAAQTKCALSSTPIALRE